jgi:hypothetical protein
VPFFYIEEEEEKEEDLRSNTPNETNISSHLQGTQQEILLFYTFYVFISTELLFYIIRM